MNYYKNLSLNNIVEEIGGIVYKEEWKPVSDFPYYMASSFGRIKSLPKLKIRSNKTGSFITKERVLKQHHAINSNGYLGLTMCNDKGKHQKLAHSVIAKTFIDRKDNCFDVNHIDGVKINNTISNLEWVTKSENTKHAIRLGLFKIKSGKESYMYGMKGILHPNSKRLSQFDKNGLLLNTYDCVADAKNKTGINNISAVCIGKRKMAGGFIWKYDINNI